MMKIFIAQLLAKQKIKVALIWIASVFIFSLAYWLTWLTRPDSFILHKEFNLTPYELLISKVGTYDNDASKTSTMKLIGKTPIELDDFMKEVQNIAEEATLTQKQLEALQIEQTDLESTEKEIYAEHSEKLWKNVELYKSTAIKSQASKVEVAKSISSAFLKIAESSDSPGAALAAANAKVEVAKAEYELAVRRAEVADYVVQHLREFADCVFQ